jgi:ACS family tartrate transporter-like MFS transporter
VTKAKDSETCTSYDLRENRVEGSVSTSAELKGLETRTLRKVKWRLLPFSLLIFIICYIDRANIGYAALEMNTALGINSAAFGLVIGIFFLGYGPFEVPSNLLFYRYGARRWISRIMVTWGVVAVITGLIQNVHQLYVLRFLLGVAEAGFWPGILLYFTFWFPQTLRSQAVAILQAGVPIASFIGAPIATLILDHIRWTGIESWRWVFILEGLPAVVMGVVVFYYLTDRPEQAKWLSPAERNWLVAVKQKEHQAKVQVRQYTKLQAFLSPRVWRLAIIYFSMSSVQSTIVFWLPTIIKGVSRTLTNTAVGLLTMIPYFFTVITMILWSRHSDRTGERKFHAALAPLIAMCGLGLFGLASGLPVKIVGMTIALIGIYCFHGPFWSLPAQFLSEGAAAVALSTISSVGMLAGFFGSVVVGYLRSATGNMNSSLYFLGSLLVLNFLLILTMRIPKDKKELL